MNKLPITTGYIEKHLTFLKLSLFKTKKTLLFVPTLNQFHVTIFSVPVILFCSCYIFLIFMCKRGIHEIRPPLFTGKLPFLDNLWQFFSTLGLKPPLKNEGLFHRLDPSLSNIPYTLLIVMLNRSGKILIIFYCILFCKTYFCMF